MKLEEKLVSLRKAKGFTQMKVAEELDVSRQAVSRWESGSALPSTENLKVLSELYGVSVDYLLNKENENSFWSAKETGDKQKRKKWTVCVLCIFIVVVVITIIGVVMAQKEPENIRFSEVESEDWNSVGTDDIQIEW